MLDRPVDCDLDITVLPIYPQKLDPPEEARKGEKKKGTVHGFHFATLIAHDDEHDKDLVVAQVPYTDGMKPLELVKKLVEQAREHCTIKTLTLDSAFSGTDVIHYLKEENVKFITRLKRHGGDIKGILAQMTERFDDFEDHRISASDSSLSETVRVVSEPDWKHATKEALRQPVETSQTTLENFDEEGDPRIPDVDDLDSLLWKSRRPYATNIEDMPPEKVIRRYKYRWRVENSYADKKSKMLGKTQSRHHGVRVFLFWLTTLLYNGWMLTRAFIRLDFPKHAPRDRPPVSARQFMKSILGIPYG
jgi:IS4 transposase